MPIGYFIVKAEPAVYVLNKQVEEVTDGAISLKAMGNSPFGRRFHLGGLAMVRVLTGVSILWFPAGPCVYIGISFVVPKLFTAIAFDARAVRHPAPMTATFCRRWHRVPAWPWAAISSPTLSAQAMVAMTPAHYGGS